MKHERRNYCYEDPKCSDGDEFVACNLTQAAPDTIICKDAKGLVFRNCNLVNCVVPGDAKIEGCNTSQISRCTHEHPELIERGLKACAEDCTHRVGATKQTVEIPEDEYRKLATADRSVSKAVDADGVTIQAFTKSAYVYRDKVVSNEGER